jgi:hypothetical protein
VPSCFGCHVVDRVSHGLTPLGFQTSQFNRLPDSTVLAEAAGLIAGFWYASPATHVGYELIGAGMLILAGDGRGLPMDYDELERWTRGWL